MIFILLLYTRGSGKDEKTQRCQIVSTQLLKTQSRSLCTKVEGCTHIIDDPISIGSNNLERREGRVSSAENKELIMSVGFEGEGEGRDFGYTPGRKKHWDRE